VLHDGLHYVKDFQLKSEDGGEGPNARVVYRAALPQEAKEFNDRDRQGVVGGVAGGASPVRRGEKSSVPTAVISAGMEVPTSAFKPWRGSIVMADLPALGLTDYGTLITGGLKVRLRCPGCAAI
jgi:hypothetical protein